MLAPSLTQHFHVVVAEIFFLQKLGSEIVTLYPVAFPEVNARNKLDISCNLVFLEYVGEKVTSTFFSYLNATDCMVGTIIECLNVGAISRHEGAVIAEVRSEGS